MSNDSRDIAQLKYTLSKNPPEINYRTARPGDPNMHDTAHIARKQETKISTKGLLTTQEGRRKSKGRGCFLLWQVGRWPPQRGPLFAALLKL